MWLKKQLFLFVVKHLRRWAMTHPNNIVHQKSCDFTQDVHRAVFLCSYLCLILNREPMFFFNLLHFGRLSASRHKNARKYLIAQSQIKIWCYRKHAITQESSKG